MVRSVVQFKLNPHVAVWRFVPHSGQKRALFATVDEHCGQGKLCAAVLAVPIRRQVEHITDWGKPGVLKPAIAAGVGTCCVNEPLFCAK